MKFLVFTFFITFYLNVNSKLLKNVVDKTGPTSPRIKTDIYIVPDPLISKELNKEANSYLVNELPGLQNFSTSHWAGLIPIPFAGLDDYGQIFHWLFEPDLGNDAINPQEDKSIPIIIWLNGGPGCSSMDGLWIENGPFRVKKSIDGTDAPRVDINPYSWHKSGWAIFIDQPIGTGFSIVNPNCKWCDYVQNQTAVNMHMYSALQSLLLIYPFLQERKIFISGESYAGHYIPSLADYILQVNSHGVEERGEFYLEIGGLAIGNGWSDPIIQYNFGQFAHNMGLISAREELSLRLKYSKCQLQESRGDFSGNEDCNILDIVLASSGVCPSLAFYGDDDSANFTETFKADGCYGPTVNYYDIRSYYVSPGSQWPENSPATEKYLNRRDVRKAIHTDVFHSTPFTECGHSGHYLAKFDGMGVVKEITRLLDQKVPMLFYNGQYDMICNHMGTEALLDSLKWYGSHSFHSADGGIWALKKNGLYLPAGYSRSSADGVLTFLVVIGGSHMVPMDVPEQALDMITRFVQGGTTRRTYFDAPQFKAYFDDESSISTTVTNTAVPTSSSPSAADSRDWEPSVYRNIFLGVALFLASNMFLVFTIWRRFNQNSRSNEYSSVGREDNSFSSSSSSKNISEKRALIAEMPLLSSRNVQVQATNNYQSL